MSSAFDLYKGTVGSKIKSKTTGESSQPVSKKVWTEEPVAAQEIPSTLSEVEISETLSKVTTPSAQVAEEPGVQVHDIPSLVEEPVVENTREEVRKELFKIVARLTAERVDKVSKNRKYLKASSSFSKCNINQAFTRGANDIVMVSSSSWL